MVATNASIIVASLVVVLVVTVLVCCILAGRWIWGGAPIAGCWNGHLWHTPFPVEIVDNLPEVSQEVIGRAGGPFLPSFNASIRHDTLFAGQVSDSNLTPVGALVNSIDSTEVVPHAKVVPNLMSKNLKVNVNVDWNEQTMDVDLQVLSQHRCYKTR